MAAALERPVVEETSPECRAELGDARCRVAMAGRRRFAMVTAIESAVLTLDQAEPTPNCYGGGRLRWFGGANSGLEDAIARSEGATLTLRRPPRFDAGGRVELIEGCDKSVATCEAPGQLHLAIDSGDGIIHADAMLRRVVERPGPPPWPVIAAAEGLGATPAHRGIAYAVFENLELADFSNRIPSLTFEVTADPGPVMAGDMIGEIAGGLIACGAETRRLAGFSAYGSSARAVVETLAGAAGAWFRSDSDRLALVGGADGAVTVQDEGTRAHGRAGTRGRRTIAAADSAPRTLTLTHYDPARDYQGGVQRAGRRGAGGREVRMELPAAIDAGGAKTMAEAALARLDIERERRSVALGWDRIGIRPGENVMIAGTAGVWRVDRWSLEAMVLTLDCVRVAPAAMAMAASGGRVLGAPDVTLGRTLVHAFEFPALDESAPGIPRLAIAAAGTEPGWRSAALLMSSDGGANWTAAGSTAAPAILGTVRVPPGAGSTLIEDRINATEVELGHDAMILADADAAAINAGANLAMVGEELLQFGRAEPMGNARWRLRNLWRGRRGTAGIGTQIAGDRFVLIDSETLTLRDLPIATIGGSVVILAQGVGDGSESADAHAAIAGSALLPLAPVHFTASPGDGGDTRFSWVRRSRTGWRWIDGMDAPLAEESERYQVHIAPADGTPRSEEAGSPMFVLPAADRTGAVTISVRQIGTHGLSRAATLTLPATGDL